MKYMGITRRWFLTVALIVILILVTVCFAMIISLHNYYYNTASLALDAYSADQIASTFALYGGGSTNAFRAASREFIESFPDKDEMAVWAIDQNGRVILSTTGFQILDEVDMPDYQAALTNGLDAAKWTGKLPSGEKIMASTCVYRHAGGKVGGAIRFMISMEAIDAQLVRLSLVIAGAALLMFFLLVLSSSFFIRSIVNPVKDIGETAKRIAGGELDARIDHYPYNDEIGELCAIINDMATKLAAGDRMKNDFISTVSHELRTPLTAIKGWGETLLQIGATDPAMTERGMGVIISESARLNEMVEELLDFSRMSSGRLQLKFETIDLLAELDEIVFSFKERAIREGIELVYNVPQAPAPANGDASRIRQVFINILDNSLKYTTHGGKIIVTADMTEKSALTVTIADTGAGIPAEDLPHVKEKFYKANSTVRGSGIGLAVVDEIVKLHEGTLTIDSVLGEGTTVRVTLPLVTAKEGETA
ncbi:MAG: HAMP domain-containing histidine kinase [Clostridia bacterium]|nr:HAMP domain-containing histidine kinase [Clostridia bacterium]